MAKFNDLRVAAINDDIDEAKKLVRKAPLLPRMLSTKSGMTGLHVSAEAGSLAVLGYLLAQLKGTPKEQLDVNRRDKQGRPPVHLATYAKDTDIHIPALQYFLDYGVDTTLIDRSGKTLLHHAAYNASPAAVAHILDTVPSSLETIDTTDRKGRTPAHLALWNTHLDRQVDTLAALQSRGADLTTTDLENKNLLHYTAQVGNPAAAAFILEHAPSSAKSRMLNTQDYKGRTPLHLCFDMRNKSELGRRIYTFKHLLDAGANPFIKDNTGKSAFGRFKEHYHGMLSLLKNHHEAREILVSINKTLQTLDHNHQLELISRQTPEVLAEALSSLNTLQLKNALSLLDTGQLQKVVPLIDSEAVDKLRSSLSSEAPKPTPEAKLPTPKPILAARITEITTPTKQTPVKVQAPLELKQPLSSLPSVALLTTSGLGHFKKPATARRRGLGLRATTLSEVNADRSHNDNKGAQGRPPTPPTSPPLSPAMSAM